ncbi:ABC transporter permease [Roseomonas sp. CCTCC AB2023176]|uniref:ABC transporter permease n=1 Tax=Roseomonas sp. CCTCC AB2023176 TaxID=3342640 RepID=UPI0035E2856D
MSSYVLGRMGGAVAVLLATYTLAFVLLQALPGDAVLIKFLGSDMGLTPEALAEIRSSYGADAPVWLQYVTSLGRTLTGDLGTSIQTGAPVWAALSANLPATIRLAVLGFLAASLLAVGIAALATLAPFAWLRGATASIPSLFVAIPVFWLGITLIQVFSFQLGLVSVISPGPLEGLILPVLTLAVPISAPLAGILIRSIDRVMAEPFVAVARAKGASPRWVLLRHVARNAILPTLTIAGVLFGELLGGAVVTEAVFNLSGLGGLTQQAVGNQDFAVLQGIVLVSALAFVLISLAVDLAAPLLDPRLVRRGAVAAR